MISLFGPRARRGGQLALGPRAGLGALAYLVVFGSHRRLHAYAYALRHASATVVGTYAYVNPVVAVLLGWLILHEAITGADHRRDGADPGRRAHDPARARTRTPRVAERRAARSAAAAARRHEQGPGMSRPSTAAEERGRRRFEDGTLPKARVDPPGAPDGGAVVRLAPADAGGARAVREGILRLNAAHGVPTTPTRGYHETITRFYMHMVCDYVASEDRSGRGEAGRSGWTGCCRATATGRAPAAGTTRRTC